LNIIATSFWAFRQEPLFGSGICRFVAINTYHHQQWSQEVPWVRGLGLASHFNELGILVELGILGLILWLGVLLPLCWSIIQALRTLPADRLRGRRLAFIAFGALVALLVAGTSADLRLFDFPTATVLLLVGLAVGEYQRRGPIPVVPLAPVVSPEAR
jgi:O-antigen ligase